MASHVTLGQIFEIKNVTGQRHKKKGQYQT